MQEKAMRLHFREEDAFPETKREDPPLYSANPRSRRQQRKAIRQSYAAAKRSGADAAYAAKISARVVRKTAAFLKTHRAGIALACAAALAALMITALASSFLTMLQGSSSAIMTSTYPSADADMLAAEAQYTAMEADLQSRLDSYEATHSYDEYRYDLDSIGHDPYVLVSVLTALHGQWTADAVAPTLEDLFARQYILTEEVTVETGTDSPENGEECSYSICHVRLENFNLSHVPAYMMTQEQLALYAMYMGTLGNRPDLFPDSDYVSLYFRLDCPVYGIPPEALADETFAAMMEEATKYLGFPYVWGGSTPATSFDCSGFVSWVINHSGWDVGRRGATGLYNICTPVSPQNAKPGDLVFFVGTYDTDGMSHVGIFVGDNRMIHCGDPIGFADLTQPYWQAHFYAFGRLPGN